MYELYEEDPNPLDLSIRKSEEQNDAAYVLNAPTKSRQAKITARKKAKAYKEAKLEQSVTSVLKGAMCTNFASKYFGVPRTTLQYRLSNKCKNKGTTGPYTVFTAAEEREIVSWLKTMERKGFPVTRSALVYKVSTYLKAHPRKTPFKDNVPGYGWLRGFLKRHPHLTMRTPESVTLASAKVSEKDIREWFHTVKSYLIDHGLIDILLDPSRVLNGDESGFCLNPPSTSVIATSGAKNVPSVETGSSKQNITVMFTFCADGSVVPPDVILSQKRLSKETIQSFPADWGLGQSENGWMDTSNFVLYIKKILYPFLVKKNVKFPVIYFVDGHKSHTALEAADACKRLGIILIALLPNATRILQPADVGVFKPLKTRWYQVVETWKLHNKFAAVTLTKFGSLLKTAMDSACTPSTIVNAFAACGLFPYNPNAVDYSKCIAKCTDYSYDAPEQSASEDSPKIDFVVPYRLVDQTLEMLGPAKIQLYTDERTENLSHEDRVLAFVYKNILCLPNNQSATDCVDATSDLLADNPISMDENCSDSEQLQNIPWPELTEPENDCFLETGCHKLLITEQADSSAAESNTTALMEKSETVSSLSPKTPSLVSFLDTPDDLKRTSKHINYKTQSYAVLTADERLEEIILKENKRDEAERMKKERADKRAMQKIKLDEEKAAKMELKLKRKAEKEAEMKKKAEEKKRKAEIKERNQQNMEKMKNVKMQRRILLG